MFCNYFTVALRRFVFDSSRHILPHRPSSGSKATFWSIFERSVSTAARSSLSHFHAGHSCALLQGPFVIAERTIPQYDTTGAYYGSIVYIKYSKQLLSMKYYGEGTIRHSTGTFHVCALELSIMVTDPHGVENVSQIVVTLYCGTKHIIHARKSELRHLVCSCYGAVPTLKQCLLQTQEIIDCWLWSHVNSSYYC